jgi:hypothetical protein
MDGCQKRELKSIVVGGRDRIYVPTAIRKDMAWNNYGRIRGSERVGIEISGTRIINIYHHRDQVFDTRGLMEELEWRRQSKWVCAGAFNCHHSLWDGNGREPTGSWIGRIWTIDDRTRNADMVKRP